jgi:hypothetical protein
LIGDRIIVRSARHDDVARASGSSSVYAPSEVGVAEIDVILDRWLAA